MPPSLVDPEEITGITSIATRALLEGLVSDMRALRADTSKVSSSLDMLCERQRDLAKHALESDARVTKLEDDFRARTADATLAQLRQQNELERVSTQLDLVAPLTAAHEQVLQQAKGAAWATKVLYAIAGAASAGGLSALFHALTR